MRIVAVALLVSSVGIPHPALAEDKVAIPQDEVCERDPASSNNGFKVHPGRLLRWLFEKYEISGKCVADRDGNETYVERAALIVSVPKERERNCKKDADGLLQARNRIDDIFFDRVPTLKARVPAGDPRKIDRLSAVDFVQGKSVTIVCLAVTPRSDSVEDKTEDKVGKLSDLKVGGWKVKLRGDQDSMEYNKGTDDYKKKATSAQFAFSEDRLAERDKFNIKAAVGLDSDVTSYETSFGSGDFRLIPYVKVESQFVRPKVKNPKSKDEREVDTKAFGTIGVLNFNAKGSPLANKFTFDPQFVLDDETDAQTFGTTIKWYPTLWSDGGANSFPPGDVAVGSLFYYHLYLAAVGRIGHVIDSGDDPTLEAKNNFMYFGPEARLVLTGQAGSFFEPFKFDARYHHLWRQTGPESALERFTSTLTYTLDKDGNVDIGLTYDSGHDYETFRERNIISTSLGYKF